MPMDPCGFRQSLQPWNGQFDKDDLLPGEANSRVGHSVDLETRHRDDHLDNEFHTFHALLQRSPLHRSREQLLAITRK